MAMKSKSRPSTTGAGGAVGQTEETSSTRRRIQEVLGQARAALRQSQQFRPSTDTKNNLSSRLTFQQQKQEDYWSSENAGEVIVKESVNPLYEGSKSSKSTGRVKSFFNQDDDFGLPFRDVSKKTQGPKILGSSRDQQRRENGRKQEVSSDTSSVSTADLKVSDSDSTDTSSSAGTITSFRQARSKLAKVGKEVKIIEPPRMQVDDPQISMSAIPTAAVSAVPSPMKLTPLQPKIMEDENQNDLEMDKPRPVSVPQHTVQVDVQADDLGFSRATIKKPTNDPHWFEKALLVRGEPISEAAYRAFKKAHEIQGEMKMKAGENVSKTPPLRLKMPVASRTIVSAENSASTVPNPGEPEFTADWISEVDATSYISERNEQLSIIQDEISIPEMASMTVSVVDDHLSTIPDLVEYEDKTLIDDINLESEIHTATELEASGVLGEIAQNLRNVLQMSDKPVSQDFSRMSAEERSFAQEYDEAMKDKDEPLGAIFHSVYSSSGDPTGEGGASKSDQRKEDHISKSLGLSDRDDEEESTNYENTFISTNSSQVLSKKTEPSKSTATVTKASISASASKKSLSRSRSSLKAGIATTTSGSSVAGKDKKGKDEVAARKSKASSDKTNNNTSASMATSTTTENQKSISSNSTTTKKPRPPPGGGAKTTPQSPKEKDTRTDRRISISRKPPSPPSTTPSPTPLPLEPPANRHQKNIQIILEKEVYQSELKRQRAHRLREERKQERREQIAIESLERNKNVTWKEPDTTEILLPELFKYKSVSGLQAAKAKKSEHFRNQPGMNYGAPYFQLNGSVEDGEGTSQMMAQAQVETLDIPDLVREVLASNERMYRMTVEASREMNKVYKEKIHGKR